MASDERNALAELAERLSSNEVRVVEGDEFPIHLSINAILDFRKARHIIAELAKVIDCKEPERIMPIDKPYDDIILYAPYDNGLTESNSINEDEKRFIFDLANAAFNCREIAEEEAEDGK